jgi:glutaredoxin
MGVTVYIFTMNSCGYCSNLKKNLSEISIPYTEIEISHNKNIWDQVVEQTGHNVLPTVFIKKDDSEDGPVYVPGRDYQTESEIVEIIKNYFN